MKKRFIIALIFGFTALNIQAQAQAQDKITEVNTYSMPSVGGQALSPKGDKIVYVVSTTDPIANNGSSTMYLLDIKTGAKETLLSSANDAQWSPDGSKIAFRTTINKVSGIYYITLTDKTPKLVAEVHNSNHFIGLASRKNYQWSPDGKSIAFVGADINSAPKQHPNEPRVINRILYKSRTSFSDNLLTKIYVADVATGTVKCLTNDKFDSFALNWSPDSKSIAYLSNHTDEPDNNYNNDIFLVDVATAKVKRLTDTHGTEHSPNFSPDGKYIMYAATTRERNTKDSSLEDTKLYIYNTSSAEVKCVTTNLDARLSDGKWAADSKTFYIGFAKEGRRVLYKASIENDKITPIFDQEASAGSLDFAGNKMIFSYSTPYKPNEIYYTENDGKTIKQLTFDATEWIKNKQIAKNEAFWFPTFDGTMVQGFISYPSNITPGQKLPVIHRIHGGPHGAFGLGYTDIDQILTGKGYVVVSINPRGSTGYGQKFTEGTYKAWGGGDYEDLMKGMDYAIEKYPFINKDKMGVTGGSYGGYMTNWVVTQTNRYKAALTSASVSNLISFYGTSIYADLIENEFGGMLWDHPSLLWHFSPMAHIKNVKTPTLIVHGEQDMDVPVTQAEEFFISLKKLGVPTEFIRYPGEGHGLAQPKNRLYGNQKLIEWFDKYLK